MKLSTALYRRKTRGVERKGISKEEIEVLEEGLREEIPLRRIQIGSTNYLICP